jgi:hypothetical protein
MVVTPLVLSSALLSPHLLVLPVQFIGAASVHLPPLPYRILAWLPRKRSYPTLRTMVGMRELQMTAVTVMPMATAMSPGKNHPPMPARPRRWASQIGSKSSEKLMTNTMPMSARKDHIKYQEPYSTTPKKRPTRIPLAARWQLEHHLNIPCIGYGPTSRCHLHHASCHPRQTRRLTYCLQLHERHHLLHPRRTVDHLRRQKRGQRERERRVHIPKAMKRRSITNSRLHLMPSVKKGAARNLRSQKWVSILSSLHVLGKDGQ